MSLSKLVNKVIEAIIRKTRTETMETRPVTIHVNVETARIFEALPEEQRRKLEVLLSLKLSEATRQKKPLEAVMTEISDNAQSRGLTPEILDSILHEQ
jgi:hypothetical protein